MQALHSGHSVAKDFEGDDADLSLHYYLHRNGVPFGLVIKSHAFAMLGIWPFALIDSQPECSNCSATCKPGPPIWPLANADLRGRMIRVSSGLALIRCINHSTPAPTGTHQCIGANSERPKNAINRKTDIYE